MWDTNENTIMNAMFTKIRDGLDQKADEIIDQKVKEFESRLRQQKGLVVDEIMRSIRFMVNIKNIKGY